MNLKSKIILWILILGIILLPFTVKADGGVYTIKTVRIDEKQIELPSQKAIILWNDTTETLILSTKIKVEDLENIAWVTPLPSKTKPQVERGEIEVFTEVIPYLFLLAEIEYKFYRKGAEPFGVGVILLFIGGTSFVIAILKRGIKGSFLVFTLLGLLFTFLGFFHLLIITGARVGEMKEEVVPIEVIEIKKVDIYDVIILKATNATYMVDWLNNQGYKVSSKSIPILQDYCNQSNFYFIVNKINLQNLSEKERIKVKEKFAEGAATPLKIIFTPEKPFYPLKLSSINGGNTIIDVYFFSLTDVKDISQILKVQKSRDLDYALSVLRVSSPKIYFTIITKFPELLEYHKMTWFRYEGSLSNLQNDSYFEYS